jgi:orotidine-5'-phosphate decarboxylase
MKNYADRLISAIEQKGNPCIVGLDPRIDQMPDFILRKYENKAASERIIGAISSFHKIVINAIADIVPGVKPQIAFYEQYGLPGMKAFENTLAYAKEKGLITIVDAKRNDIGSTAQAYSNTFLGRTDIFGKKVPIYDVDCITVSPFLGEDSLMPFVNDCLEYGKGIFVLVKTSNPGSVDLQDLRISESKEQVYISLARLVKRLGKDLVGKKGYSSIGAVVGATYPNEAELLRELMPNNIFLVPGYGAQGATGKDIVNCFNTDKPGNKIGAVVNASRSITYKYGPKTISETDFVKSIEKNIRAMITDVNGALDKQ